MAASNREFSMHPMRRLSDNFDTHQMVQALRDIIETRLDAMDKALVLNAENINHVPTLLDREVKAIKELYGQKFDDVQVRFVERDLRAKDRAEASERAVQKSEANFT